MRNKTRVTATIFSSLLSVLLALELAGNAELLLTHQQQLLTLHPLRLLALLTPRGRLLWALISALGLLGVWWAVFSSASLNYRSRMVEIVPGFEVPAPEGQGQHGTAWWLDKREYDRVFETIDTSRPVPLPEELEQRYRDEMEVCHES